MFDEIRGLTKLAVSCAKIANHFYQPDGQPYPDRTYREKLPSLNALQFVTLGNLAEHQTRTSYILREAVPTPESVNWLGSHGITQIANYTAGNSARVCIVRRDDGHVFALRTIAKDEDYEKGPRATAFNAAENRLGVPLVLQPVDRTFTSYESNDRFSTRYKVLLELLPVVPVLPNGIASIDVTDGHSQFFEEKIFGVPRFSAAEEEMLENGKVTFVSLVKAAGFQLSRVADIGILPDGAPVFVDPDVIRSGLISPIKALQKLQDFTASLGLSHIYSWQDRNGTPKQTVMFPASPILPLGGRENAAYVNSKALG